MKARANRYYLFESLVLLNRRDAGNRHTSIADLQKLARRVWRDHHKGRLSTPLIKAGGGDEDGMHVSYYEIPPVHTIALTKSQQCPQVLLHEMTHALGRYPHDAKFSLKYFALLEQYVGYDACELELQKHAFDHSIRGS